MSRRKWLLCALMFLILLPFLVQWPFPFGKVIHVYDDHTGQHTVLRSAMNMWNEAKVGTTFVFTTDRGRADVVVRTAPTQEAAASHCHELGNEKIAACVDWVGAKPWGKPVAMFIPPRQHSWAQFLPPVAVHELGHVLGLGHEYGRCSIMNVSSFSCRAFTANLHSSWQGPSPYCHPNDDMSVRVFYCDTNWEMTLHCGPTQRDIRNARAIYGGPGNPQYQPFCPSRFTLPSQQKQARSLNGRVLAMLRHPRAMSGRLRGQLHDLCTRSEGLHGGLYWSELTALPRACTYVRVSAHEQYVAADPAVRVAAYQQKSR